MGRDKAEVPFRGEPMISHVARSLEAAGLAVIVVGRVEAIDGLPSIPDDGDPGQGPMSGMLTALRAGHGRDVFLVAVDQPLLRPETVQAIMRTAGDAVVPCAGGHPQVTCALYRDVCLDETEAALERGELKLRRMLDNVATTYVHEAVWSAWGEDGRSWLSLDTPEAVLEAENLGWGNERKPRT
jgi:molybdopterin-guanine dinucleotide biosynthesis protein A